MAMRQPFFRIYGDVGFALPVIAVVVDAGKHHGLIGLELGKSFVPPMRCELRCQVSVVLLQNEETRPVLKVSLDHFFSSLDSLFKQPFSMTELYFRTARGVNPFCLMKSPPLHQIRASESGQEVRERSLWSC